MKVATAHPSTARAADWLPTGRGRTRGAAGAGLCAAVLALLGAPARGQTPPPAVFTTLYSFSAVDDNHANPEGAQPQAGLLLGLDGNFYGTASSGGANGSGTVFRCTPGGTVSALYTFSASNPMSGDINADGASPEAALIQDADGNLYGTAFTAGAHGAGTAFEVTLAGGFTDLHDFGSGDGQADGTGPEGSLLLTPDGELVGTASGGGSSQSNGALFFLDGTSFGPALDFGGSLGTQPLGSLAFSNPPGAQFPTIYGACQFGGNTGDPEGIGSGVIYGLAGGGPDGSLRPVYTFTARDSNSQNTDGAQPAGGVILGRDNNLYGTTKDGGPNGDGTVWQIVVDPDSGAVSLTVLHAFAGTDGRESLAPLVEGSDGSFYGTTAIGGASNNGVVFRVTATKALTVLHAFSATDNNSANGDGAFPSGGLVEVRPGSFVGTAFAGGANAEGTIFELDVAPVITSAATAAGNAGSAFAYQITAADAPGNFSVEGLGDGLTFNAATGLISGTPTAPGTLNLTVAASNDAGTGSQAVTVTIKGTTLEFGASSYSVNEAAGTLTVHVARVNSTAGAASVVCATSSGTAKSGTDYTGKSQTLSWADGDGTEKSFTVSIEDLGITDGSTRTFSLKLSSPSSAAVLGSPASAKVTITENDPVEGELEFSAASYQVGDQAGTVTVQVKRGAGSVGAVTVVCGTKGGTAKSGTNYTGKSATLSWAAGDTSAKNFVVTIKNEGSKDASSPAFEVVLSTPGGGAILGSPDTATVTIVETM